MAEYALKQVWDAEYAASTACSNNEPDEWMETTHRMASGDSAAFAVFYDAYFELALRVTRRATGRDEQTCLDLVQEVMLKAMRRMKPIPNASQLSAFVRVLAQRTALDWLRREGRFARYRNAIQETADSASGAENTAHLDPDRILWLETQLEQLDADLRAMLDWRFRLGWTLQSIASRMGLKPGAVDGRIRRAVERLREQSEIDFHE